MSNQLKMIQMLELVAEHLGNELLARMAFVGGCTTALLITDNFTLQHIRETDDVDLIVEVLSYGDYEQLCRQLRDKGFRASPEDDVICRWRLASLIVDVMPINEHILGFSNYWYPDALKYAANYPLSSGKNIRVVSPVYFLATKIEAFHGRGERNFLQSRDIEDIVSLVDGYESLCEEVQLANDDVKQAIATAIEHFLLVADFEYAVQSVAQDSQREQLLFERLQRLATG